VKGLITRSPGCSCLTCRERCYKSSDRNDVVFTAGEAAATAGGEGTHDAIAWLQVLDLQCYNSRSNKCYTSVYLRCAGATAAGERAHHSIAWLQVFDLQGGVLQEQ
jgi:hypothetical protein